MLFAGVIAHVKSKLTKRSEYRRMIKEVDSLSRRDLEDLNTSRADLVRYVRTDVYGSLPV